MTASAIKLSMTPEEAAACGMVIALHAEVAPDRPAILSPLGDRTYAALNARSNQLVRALRSAGLKEGDAVALLCANRPEFVETCVALSRCGMRLTPINWHLTAEEIGYIVENCEAKSFIADARFAEKAEEVSAVSPHLVQKLAVAGEIAGFASYDDALDVEPAHNIEDPTAGTQMLYTSGTTGHPKGVYRKAAPPVSPLLVKLRETAAFDPAKDVALSTGPLYHAAPLALNLNFPLVSGVGVVLMDRWDAEETLKLVAKHNVTHTHVVPTMLHRIL